MIINLEGQEINDEDFFKIMKLDDNKEVLLKNGCLNFKIDNFSNLDKKIVFKNIDISCEFYPNIKELVLIDCDLPSFYDLDRCKSLKIKDMNISGLHINSLVDLEVVNCDIDCFDNIYLNGIRNINISKSSFKGSKNEKIIVKNSNLYLNNCIFKNIQTVLSSRNSKLKLNNSSIKNCNNVFNFNSVDLYINNLDLENNNVLISDSQGINIESINDCPELYLEMI